jgi:pantoate--beta-alanine ligase
VRLTRTSAEFRALLEEARQSGRSVGLVPTMGALHAGHRSLVERAVGENDTVAVTIFVNPLQFGDPADLERYPRDLDTDLEVCRAAGAQLRPPATTVSVGGLGERWEGASRPGHFDGVSTVVTKLFALAGCCRAYFGEKDFQQLALVKRLAADLCLPVKVVGCPTVREPDGLALSSRNVRLSPAERRAAIVLWRALAAGEAALRAGADGPGAVVAAMEAEFVGEPLAALDYAAVVAADDLTVPSAWRAGDDLRLLVAAQVGPVRLIDNCPGAAPAAAGVPGAARGKDLVACDAG